LASFEIFRARPIYQPQLFEFRSEAVAYDRNEEHLMLRKIGAAIILGGLPVMLAHTAYGGEGVEVKITNDGTSDIIVTVYDMNTNPRKMVLTNARINGFTSVPISLVGNANGEASLSWTATSTDGVSKKCGHAETTVSNSASVNVHADSACSA
jgi:hypothetical protein